jgi:hypothetical protein
MRVGCGLEVRKIKGRNYLYFWKMDEVSGRRRRSWKYLGPTASVETKRRALTELDIAYESARAEMERKLRIVRQKLARMQ